MGEPLNNFEHVKAAVLGLTDSNLFGMGQKTPFLRCHLDINCIILPRQARDKHRESTQKRMAFSSRASLRIAGRRHCRPRNSRLVQLA